jgi:hypothetical protein
MGACLSIAVFRTDEYFEYHSSSLPRSRDEVWSYSYESRVEFVKLNGKLIPCNEEVSFLIQTSKTSALDVVSCKRKS